MNSKPFPVDTETLTFSLASTKPVNVKLELFDALKCFTKEVTTSTKEIEFKETEKLKKEVTVKLNTKEFKHFIVQIYPHVKQETTIDFSVKNQNSFFDEDKKILKPNTKNIALCYVFYNHIDKSWNFLQLNYPNEDLYLEPKNKQKSRKVIPFHFVEQVEILNIKIEKGSDLAIQDLNGFSDPYCIVYVGKSKVKTSVKYKTLNPVWGEQLDVKLSNPGSIDQIIVDCWDYDLAKPHDFLGQIIIDPSTLDLKKKLKFDFQKREKKKDSHVKGSLELIFDINNKDLISEHKSTIFGVSMMNLMERNEETEKYPKKVKLMMDYLMVNGPKIEGIFRKTASVAKVKELSALLDSGEEIPLDNVLENHVVTIASLFKLYIRELPDPLLTWELYDQFLAVLDVKEEEKKLIAYASLLTEIPFFNRALLHDLMTLCNKINDNKDENKMDFKNLAVIFGICILTTKDEMQNAKDIQSVQNVFIELMKMHPKHFDLAEKMMEEEDEEEN